MTTNKDETKEPETRDETKEPETRDETKEPETEPQQVPDITGQIAPVLDSIAALNAEIESIKTAVSALANAGAVNASVSEDNGDTEEYPTIDLDEVNRLIGA